MSPWRSLIAVILLACWAPTPVDAQIRRRGTPNRMLPPPASTPEPRRDRRLEPGVRTPRRTARTLRPPPLRRMLGAGAARFFGREETGTDAVFQSLAGRNLLRSRSPLAQSTASLIGRKDYLLRGDGRWRGEVPSEPEPEEALARLRRMQSAPGHYSDLLSSRLARRADALFDRGLYYFREGKLLQAREQFELVRLLEEDRPRAFLADVLVCYERRDYNMALMSLVLAIDRANTPEDLRLDRDSFYPSRGRFQRVVDSVVITARSAGSTPHAGLLLAYYAWLNGDLNTAVAAADTTVRGLQARADKTGQSGDVLRLARKFRDLLAAQRNAPPVAETPAHRPAATP